jgi:hypothetical protein
MRIHADPDPKPWLHAIFDFLKKFNFFPTLIFFQFLVIKTLDPDLDPHCHKKLDPDPH